jgi:hypothetical protein
MRGRQMSTIIRERSRDRTTWVCDNCHGETTVARKRCAECGTSRY